MERGVLRNKKNPYKVYETPKVPVLVGSSKKQVLTELEGQELYGVGCHDFERLKGVRARLSRESLWLICRSDNSEGRGGEAGLGRETLRAGCRSDKGVTNPQGNLGAWIICQRRVLGRDGQALADCTLTTLSHCLVLPRLSVTVALVQKLSGRPLGQQLNAVH